MPSGGRDEVAINCAVMDGCAVTLRALCYIVGVSCNFKNMPCASGQNRTQDLFNCCNKNGQALVSALTQQNQRCLLEVLYLGNRAVAHPADGNIDHKVGMAEMTGAINVVLDWLVKRKTQWPALGNVPNELLESIT